MNLDETRYSGFALVREMLGTADAVAAFSQSSAAAAADAAVRTGRLMFTGEGSSRIFPAKNAARRSRILGQKVNIQFEGCRQAMQYDLSSYAVVLASNSGRTKETMALARKLRADDNPNRFALTANSSTPLEAECTSTHVLGCGWEQAVAATKSVVEQALWAESVIWNMSGIDMSEQLALLPDALTKAMTMPVDPRIVEWATGARTIYFAGYNDGVAEELTLKTNEITRRKSDFLEGTYALHGVEEVMESCDIVFIVDPIEEEMDKYRAVLEGNAGCHVVAISDKQTQFPTVIVPSLPGLQNYVYLCAGWNILVEIGMALGINLDKPEHARKVGNEM